MCRFIFIFCLIAFAGGAGGLANYLLLPAPSSGKRSLSGAFRFIFSGGIVAFVVPLFLSLAQSALVRSIFDYSGAGQAYPDILIFAGFCVVAGFASRAFMDTMTSKMMQMQQDVRKAEDKAQEADKKAVEAIELTEENADRVAEAVGANAEPAERERLPTDHSAIKSPSPVATTIANKLKPQERDVLSAMTRYSKRTQTGVARDAGVPRNQVGEIIDEMRDMGVIHFTTSANTGGPRVQLTPLGTDVLNAFAPKIIITDVTTSREVPKKPLDEANEE